MDFTIEDLRLIRALCVTSCPQYPSVPMWEPWNSLYTKADLMLRRAIQAEEDRKAYDAAPFHVCDCGTVCRTKEEHERMWCPKCDNIWYKEN